MRRRARYAKHTLSPHGGPQYQLYSNKLNISQSIFSGHSGPFSARSRGTILEDRPVSFQDIKSIMPTVLILIFTLLIMVTVIPYAFSNVIKQLQAVKLLEQQQGEGSGFCHQV